VSSKDKMRFVFIFSLLFYFSFGPLFFTSIDVSPSIFKSSHHSDKHGRTFKAKHMVFVVDIESSTNLMIHY